MCGRLRVGKAIFPLQCWSVRPCVRPLDAVLSELTDFLYQRDRELIAWLRPDLDGFQTGR